jgi:hypothetical protein
MTNAWGRQLALFALVAAFAALVGTGGAVAQSAKDRDATPTTREQEAKQPSLDPLLDRFPIGTGRVRTGNPIAQGANDAESPSEGASGLLWVLIALWAGVMALLVTFGVRALLRHRRGESATGSSFSPAPVGSPETGSQAGGGNPRAAEPSTERDVRRPVVQSGDSGRPESERQAGDQPAEGLKGEHRDVVKGVAGILEAAEAAADQIRAEAIEAAAGIRKAAEDEAKARLASAEQAAAKVRGDAASSAKETRRAAEAELGSRLGESETKAQRLLADAEQAAAKARSDAESSARETRRAAEAELASRLEEAEAQAQRILADAESQALAVREAAAEKARQIHVTVRELEEALRSQAQPLEEDVRRALETFRGTSGRVEELLADLTERPDASLIDDLNESARTAEARVDGKANR